MAPVFTADLAAGQSHSVQAIDSACISSILPNLNEDRVQWYGQARGDRLMAAKAQIEIGQVYEKIGVPRPRWRVAKIIQHREGPHALLVSLEDPTRQITLAADVLLDTRMTIRVTGEEGPVRDIKPWDSLESEKPNSNKAA
jgi:hypothetical protein